MAFLCIVSFCNHYIGDEGLLEASFGQLELRDADISCVTPTNTS